MDLLMHFLKPRLTIYALFALFFLALVEGRLYTFYMIEMAGYTRGKTLLSVKQL